MFEEDSVTYTGQELDSGELAAWALATKHGLAGHRTKDNTEEFRQPLVVAYWTMDFVRNAKGTSYWRNRVLKVARDFSKYNFAISNKDDFQQELADFGLSSVSGDKPLITAWAGGLKYRMEAEFSVDNLRTFVQQLEAGSLEPHIKSEAVPDNSGNTVKVAVARNFAELVTRSAKDVLVELYAPWCDHCRRLEPVLEELGLLMAGEEVEVVKMDETANDAPPEYEVTEYPSLYWLPRSTKVPELYPGGLQLQDLVRFISEKATTELRGWDRRGRERRKTEL